MPANKAPKARSVPVRTAALKALCAAPGYTMTDAEFRRQIEASIPKHMRGTYMDSLSELYEEGLITNPVNGTRTKLKVETITLSAEGREHCRDKGLIRAPDDGESRASRGRHPDEPLSEDQKAEAERAETPRGRRQRSE